MKIISFYKNNHSEERLHIETEGGTVDIRFLTNSKGQQVTSIEIRSDDGWEYIPSDLENGENIHRLVNQK